MENLAGLVGEKTMFARTGGAPSLAVGIARIFSGTLGGPRLMAIWYHFAIMFEALFILTCLDAGSRVGRFILQDLLGSVWRPLARTSWYPGAILAGCLIVSAWGYFLYQGVMDPLGGINSLWPLFGIANQLLAGAALCVGTSILLKMRKTRYVWVTLLPMVWLVVVTQTAGFQKMFHPNPRIGFLAEANRLSALIASGKITPENVAATQRLIFNNRLDAVVTGLLAILVLVVLADSTREWVAILRRRKVSRLRESEYVSSALAAD
jgi:carbon starvation protein